MSDNDLPRRRVPGDSAIDDLQTIIQQQEDELGPLQTMENDGTDTILTFDDTRDPPDIPIELKSVHTVDEERDGFQRIIAGICLLGGAEMLIGAFRAVPPLLLHDPAPDAPNLAPETAAAPPALGQLSIKYETGGRGPGTVSPAGTGDIGGVSYGSYQMTSRPNGGTVIRFVTAADFPFQADFAGLVPGSAEFTAAWKDLAARQSGPFQAAQHDFIKRNYFDVLVRKTIERSGLDLTQRSLALQNAAWSTAVQHGPATPIITRAIGNLPGAVTPGDGISYDRELIKAIYAERGRSVNGTLVYFRSSPPRIQAAAAARFVREQQDALNMLAA